MGGFDENENDNQITVAMGIFFVIIPVCLKRSQTE